MQYPNILWSAHCYLATDNGSSALSTLTVSLTHWGRMWCRCSETVRVAASVLNLAQPTILNRKTVVFSGGGYLIDQLTSRASCTCSCTETGSLFACSVLRGYTNSWVDTTHASAASAQLDIRYGWSAWVYFWESALIFIKLMFWTTVPIMHRALANCPLRLHPYLERCAFDV